MKIAYLCNFAYPFWEGVWNNIYHTAEYMIKRGHEVHIFCSNSNPSGENFNDYEVFEGIHIHRFPVKNKIGSYALFFNFEEDLIKLNPDIIHTHGYRTPYSTKTIKIAKKINKPCILTTHAPFERKRGPFLDLLTRLYDKLYGKKLLNSYSKVIAITRWEIPYLLKIGCKKGNIAYVPNGVDKRLFIKIKKETNKNALYLGRVSKIKNLEVIIKIAKEVPDINFLIFGPMEKGYTLKEESKNIKIVNKKFDINKEIELFKQNDFYILPSISEGFPQTLIEAMASGKIVVSSATFGGKEIIKNGENGFIFKNEQELISILKSNNINFNKIKQNAQKTAKNFLWNEIVKKTEKIYLTFNSS